MLNPVISGIVYAAEMLIFFGFFSRIADKKHSTRKILLIGFLIFETASFLNLSFENHVLINTLTSITAKILFALICFEIRPTAALLDSILLEVLNFTMEIASILGYSPLMADDSMDVNSSPILLLLVVLTSKSLLQLSCLVLPRFIKPDLPRIKISPALLFYPAVQVVCLLIFWHICQQNPYAYGMQQDLTIVCLLMFAATVVLFVVYQNQIEENNRRLRLENALSRLQTERSYYEILEQQNENLMIYAHDAKKHLAAIESLTTNAEISEYVNKLSCQLNNYSKNSHSGNKLLDVMIHKYSMDCESKGIAFEHHVRECNLKEVSDMDLVAILGNLMDNAVCAAQASARKAVSIDTTLRNGYSILIISNSCDTPPKAQGRWLASSKEHPTLHGYGLKSVAKAVHSYRGDLSWEYDEQTHTFTVTVMIGNPLDNVVS